MNGRVSATIKATPIYSATSLVVEFSIRSLSSQSSSLTISVPLSILLLLSRSIAFSWPGRCSKDVDARYEVLRSPKEFFGWNNVHLDLDTLYECYNNII